MISHLLTLRGFIEKNELLIAQKLEGLKIRGDNYLKIFSSPFYFKAGLEIISF